MTDRQLRGVLKAIVALAALASSGGSNDERIVRALEELGARAERVLDETRPPGRPH